MFFDRQQFFSIILFLGLACASFAQQNTYEISATGTTQTNGPDIITTSDWTLVFEDASGDSLLQADEIVSFSGATVTTSTGSFEYDTVVGTPDLVGISTSSGFDATTAYRPCCWWFTGPVVADSLGTDGGQPTRWTYSFSRVATADLVRVDWSGTVTSGGVVTGTIDIGDTITGTFTYDAASPRATTGICSFGVVCANYETMHDSSFSVNGLSGSQSDSEIFIFNDRVSGTFGELMFDQFGSSPAITSPGLYSGDLLAGFNVSSIGVGFRDSTSTALSDISLPSFLDENDFDNLVTSRITLVGFLDNDSVQFLVDSFTFTSVPDADGDGDGVSDDVDNCPAIANPTQEDQDSDNIGDVCDSDLDGDGVANRGNIDFSFELEGFTRLGGGGLGEAPTDPVAGTIVYEAADLGSPIDSLVSVSLTIGGYAYLLSDLGFESPIASDPNVDSIGGLVNGANRVCYGVSPDCEVPSGVDDFFVGFDRSTDSGTILLYQTASGTSGDLWRSNNFTSYSRTAIDTDNCPTIPNPAQIDDNNDGFGDACVDPSVTIPPNADVDPTATIGPETVVNKGVEIGANATVGSYVELNQNVSVGDGVNIGDGAVLNKGSSVGDGASIGPGVTLGQGVFIGAGVVIGPNTIIGKDTVVCAGAGVGDNSVLGKNNFVITILQSGSILGGVNGQAPDPVNCAVLFNLRSLSAASGSVS